MPAAAAVLPRRSALPAVLALALALVVLVPTTGRAADTGAEGAFVAAANDARAAQGLPGLVVADDLVAVARRQAVRMADSGTLHHNPNLGGEVGGWQKVGENVGRGPDAGSIHQAFMGSPAHRANILDATWTQVGVGVEVRDGRMWVAQVFRQPAAAPAPDPAPAPEPPPAPAPPPAPEPETAAPAPAPPDTEPPVATEPAAPTSPTPEEEPPARPTVAPPGDRALVMLERVAAEDAALDAA